MMPLDSWIDEEALAMMRALAPKPSAPPAAPARPLPEGLEQVPSLFSSEAEDRQPIPTTPVPPRIAPPDEAAPEAIERMRRRLAEIRQRAEIGGIVRAGPARIPQSVPMAPVVEPVPAPVPVAEPPPKPILLPITKPIEERASAPQLPATGGPATPEEPVATPPEPSPVANISPLTAAPAVPETTWIEPQVEAAGEIADQPQTSTATPETQPHQVAEPEPPVVAVSPKPLLPLLEIEETWESECLPPLEPLVEPAEQREAPNLSPAASTAPPPLPAAPLPVPEGPLSVRIAAFRHWLETDCGFTSPVVIDQRGNPLHPAEGHESMVAAAAAIGTAWAEACAAANPGAPPRAAHSAWGGKTLAIVPVPTRFGGLQVAGTVQSAISPELATAIADALRQAAGV